MPKPIVETEDSPTYKYRYKFGNAEFDSAAMRLSVDGEERKIEQRPRQLLALFLENIGEVFTKDELLEKIWLTENITPAVLPNAVSKLRIALGAPLNERLKTVASVGYRFDGPVEKTVTGQSYAGMASLSKGGPVPQRPNYILREELSTSNGRHVWRARHRKTGEPLIYKFADTGPGLQSLKREATLYRLLSKQTSNADSIVQISDWNFETAPFYLECVDAGENLKTWASQTGFLKKSSVAQQVAILIQISEAISHAHDAGVLHKDIKPSNIMVTDNGADAPPSLRLIDYGSANVVSKTVFKEFEISPLGLTGDTGSDHLRSTLLFTAPEVLKGEPASIRSDVYALGILAIQLLGGDLEQPLTTSWRSLISDPLLQSDLAKATHADPLQRFSSVAAFTGQLKMLDKRRAAQIEADKKAQHTLQLEKAAAAARIRRPWLISAALAMVLGLAGISWFAVEANQSRQRATQQAELSQASNAFLLDVLAATDPRTPGAPADASIRTALAHASNLAEERFKDAYVTREAILVTLINAFAGIYAHKEQADTYQKLIELRTEQFGEHDPRTIMANYQIGRALIGASDLEAAKKAIEIADARYEKREGDLPLLDYWAATIKGQYHLRSFEFAQSEPYYLEAIKLYAATDLDDLLLLWESKFDLAQNYSRLEKMDESLALFEEIIAPPYLGSEDVPPFRIMQAKQQYGATLTFASRWQEAIPVLEETLADMKGLYGPSHPIIAETLGFIGAAYSAGKQWQESANYLAQSRQLVCASLSEEHLNCVGTTLNEATLILETGAYQVALDGFTIAREKLVNILGPDAAPLQFVDYQIVRAWIGLERYEPISDIIDTITVEALNVSSPGDPWDVNLRALKARYLMGAGQLQEGRDLLDDLLQELEERNIAEQDIAPYRAYRR